MSVNSIVPPPVFSVSLHSVLNSLRSSLTAKPQFQSGNSAADTDTDTDAAAADSSSPFAVSKLGDALDSVRAMRSCLTAAFSRSAAAGRSFDDRFAYLLTANQAKREKYSNLRRVRDEWQVSACDTISQRRTEREPNASADTSTHMSAESSVLKQRIFDEIRRFPLTSIINSAELNSAGEHEIELASPSQMSALVFVLNIRLRPTFSFDSARGIFHPFVSVEALFEPDYSHSEINSYLFDLFARGDYAALRKQFSLLLEFGKICEAKPELQWQNNIEAIEILGNQFKLQLRAPESIAMRRGFTGPIMEIRAPQIASVAVSAAVVRIQFIGVESNYLLFKCDPAVKLSKFVAIKAVNAFEQRNEEIAANANSLIPADYQFGGFIHYWRLKEFNSASFLELIRLSLFSRLSSLLISILSPSSVSQYSVDQFEYFHSQHEISLKIKFELLLANDKQSNFPYSVSILRSSSFPLDFGFPLVELFVRSHSESDLLQFRNLAWKNV